MIKLSDYVVKFLEEIGVKNVFLLSGGGMMHLLDSVSRSNKIKYSCNLNEQATSICADASAQYNNKLGVCMVTTGPGGTNAITGVTASFLDSIPVLVISGQAKTSDLVGDKKVRQVGLQEVNITEIVKPVTKYAVTVKNGEEIKYHLQKAIHLAKDGRRGPAWIDIPLDIQGSLIDEEVLKEFDPESENLNKCSMQVDDKIVNVYNLINQSKRPVFLIGYGVVAANASREMKEMSHLLNIPVLSSWRAKGIFGQSDNLYYDHPGSPGFRYSNLILQNSDLLIIIGSRLNVAMTAYNQEHFAPKAKKIMIDIDENEIANVGMKLDVEIVSDAKVFLDALKVKLSLFNNTSFLEWINYCSEVKKRYPLINEKQTIKSTQVDGYYFGSVLSEFMGKDDVVVLSSSGHACGISNMSFEIKEGQFAMSSLGLGSMGFAVPSAIGLAIESKKRTIVLEGDGSLQHNLQELQLITTYKLPIKIFILNNKGYASIIGMQKRIFNENYAGSDSGSGVILPAIKKIAELYNLKYYCIKNNNEIVNTVTEIMNDEAAALCEILIDSSFEEIPKAMTKVAADGSLSSSLLEDLYPFIDKDELNKWML